MTCISRCRRTAVDEVAEYLVTLRVPEAPAAAALDPIEDDEKRLRLGQAARKRALAELADPLADRAVPATAGND
jgi:hypothetical protein